MIYNYLHFSFSKIRRLERKYKDLEREVGRMKKKMESNMDQASLTVTMSSETQGLHVDELLNAVSHLSTSDLAVVLKTLVFKVFKMEEILSCTRTGKKTANSGETPRPALDKAKFEAVQTAVMRKCLISIEVFRKKFDNLLKMERRKKTSQ